MKIRDLIVDIDQINRRNRMQSWLNDWNEDRQRGDEAARLTMEIMHLFELAGAKTTEEAVALLRSYPVVTQENAELKRLFKNAQETISGLEARTRITESILAASQVALKAARKHCGNFIFSENEAKKISTAVTPAIDEIQKILSDIRKRK